MLTVHDLTITKGAIGTKNDSFGISGGCILTNGTLTLERVVVSGCSASGRGGGIAVLAGSATLTNVTVTKNKTLLRTNDGDGGGMAIRNSATATLTNVTISKNKAGDQGGGLYLDSGGGVVCTNCTVTGNSAGYAQGGIYVFNNSTLTITNATIVGNKGKEQPFAGIGGGINRSDFAGTVTVQNVILSKNKPANCSGGFVLKGGNLEDGHSCGFPSGAFDIAKLGLAGLKSVGGAPATFGLKPISPAIDFGVDTDCPATDERGQARIDVVGVGTTTCDSGAFEFVPPQP